MFTGIIEEKGKVLRLEIGGEISRIHIQAKQVLEDTKIGDSIAVNGVCLTVVKRNDSGFTADVMPETLERSSLGVLKPGSSVNLERAMPANGRFGGHIVSGHIDGMGIISEVKRQGNAVWYRIAAPEQLMRYIVEKGSIAIDGISLTVAKVTERYFSVSIIPHTLGETILGEKKAGDIVNLENDVIGKYVERLLGREEPKEQNTTTLTREFLLRAGF